MTDSELDKLSLEDEQLLQSFFDNHQWDVPDDGFSEKVMDSLPSCEHRRLERWWTVACAVTGIVLLTVGNVWQQLLDGFFVMRVQGLVSLAHHANHLAGILAQSHNYWMLLVAMATILFVWGYNKIQDAYYG